MQAVVAGGTGLVGSALLDELEEAAVPTTALARRVGEGRVDLLWRVVDLARLGPEHVPPNADTAFCCLGTTIKAAGSQEAFRAVDHGMVLSFARACKAAGVATFILLTAAGADPRSRVFYSRVKGEVERDVAGLGFRTLVILRPSILLGERQEVRRGERLGIAAAKALRRVLPASLRGVSASTVARAMLVAATGPMPGTRIVANRDIPRLADLREGPGVAQGLSNTSLSAP